MDFVFLFLQAHFVKDCVVFMYSELIKIAHHNDVLAHVSALEFAGEEVGHEMTNEVTAVADGSSDDRVLELLIFGYANSVLVHNLQNVSSMIPFVLFDLLDGKTFLRIAK